MRFTEQPKPTGDQFTKHGKLDQLLAGAFHAVMENIEAGILQIAKEWNGK